MKKVLSLLLTACLFAALSLPAEAADSVKVTVVKTGVKADSVFNCQGYGSLVAAGETDKDGAVVSRPQAALLDKEGRLVFPYRETYNQFYYEDGVVSLTSNSSYTIAADLLVVQDGLGETDLSLYYYDINGNKLFSFIDTESTEGETAVGTSYLGGPMEDGLVLVMERSYAFSDGSSEGDNSSEQWSAYVVDKTGQPVLELPADFSTVIASGAGGIDTKKSLDPFGEGLAAFFANTYEGEDFTSQPMGYMNAKGETVLDLSGRGYTNTGAFQDGLAWVIDGNGKVGFIDKSGQEVIACAYSSGYPFCDGIAAVEKNGKWGCIDKENHVVVPFVYGDSYGSMSEDLVPMGKNGKYGLVDRQNNIVLPMEYDDVSTFEGGVAYAIKDGYVYIVTKQAPRPTVGGFDDVFEGEYYAEPVKWAVENKITAGETDTTFAPGKTCTRGQIVTFLWRANGEPEPASAANPFTDVKAGDYYYKAMLWAKEKGITSGTDDTHFSPNAACSRAQAVTFLWRANGEPAGTGSTFGDVKDGEYYTEAVKWATGEGITSGDTSTTFAPNKNCTRGQIVTFLYRDKA